MQNLISKGKNLEEAIRIGLQLMHVSEAEVDIEIIQHETNGFIGIGKKPAIVKLTLTNHYATNSTSLNEHKLVEANPNQTNVWEGLIEGLPESLSLREDNLLPISDEGNRNNENVIGKAWIKDNQIYVKDAPDHFSTVSIGPNIQLYKNQQLVKDKSAIISEKDSLHVKFERESISETKWNISIIENGLKAILHVEPGLQTIRNLREVEPNEHIELLVEEKQNVINTLEYQLVLKELENRRIIFNLNHTEIMKAINASTAGDFVIAEGRNAHQGEDGWLEVLVDVQPKNGLVENEDGTIDFRESKLIPTVEKGMVIAIVHPPIPGIPGVTVTNDPLPAKQTHPIKLKTGVGTELIEDKLVATESGRPFIEKRGMLIKASIIPKLLHQDNVSLSSGNIRFNGDVEITGEVEDYMTVEADGDIYVHKSASYSNLTTMKSIIVKGNVTNCSLDAGKNNMLIMELGHLIGIMHQQLEKMIILIKQLSNSAAFKTTDFSVTGLQPLIRILLEKKFQDFPNHAKKYMEVVENGQDYLEDEDWTHIAVSLRTVFLTLTNQVTTVHKLTSLAEKMEKLSTFSKLPVEPNSYITISDSVNSRLYSSGDINIIGKGCINTKVHAGGKLFVGGIVRGGEVYWRLGVSLEEAGSANGTKTVIATPHDQQIQIRKANEGTVLKIGNVRHVLKEDRDWITAKLNNEGYIIY